MNNKGLNNLMYPIIPFNHMKYAYISYVGRELKINIEYEKGNHYNFIRQIGGN